MRLAPAPPMIDHSPIPPADPIADLFAAHYRDLVRLVSGLLDDNPSCEEVVQDAFASLVRRGTLPAPDRQAAYLRSAVLNGARSRLRRRRVQRRNLAPVVDSAAGADDEAMVRVEHQRVLDAIRTLPRRQADVLLLRYQAELSEAEIADALGISPGSVKTHAHRGLAAVRARLEESP